MNSLFIRSALLLLSLCTGGAAFAQMMGTTPDSAPNASNFDYVRRDGEALAKLGGGNAIAGMNKLGDLSYELFIVTTSGNDGAAGWFIFRKFPWNLPIDRPKFEYRQMDGSSIASLANNSFDDGLTRLSREGWQLMAVTNAKAGDIGWYYFMREKQANQNPTGAAPPNEGNLPIAAGDFSTPKASIQTFISAAASKNVDLLSKCFADDAAEEFKAIRNKSANQKDLDDLAEMFKGATIEGEETSGTKSTVKVKLQTRAEEIELSKSANGWKILDF
jgi:hypothetical protein